jgi:hypothetical protein
MEKEGRIKFKNKRPHFAGRGVGGVSNYSTASQKGKGVKKSFPKKARQRAGKNMTMDGKNMTIDGNIGP